MIAGFVAHTIWIGTICAATGHPPITNLPEAASFVAWVVFAVELGSGSAIASTRPSFFVYPLVLLLLTISAVVGENFAVLDPELRSNVFTAHLLLSTVGVAGTADRPRVRPAGAAPGPRAEEQDARAAVGVDPEPRRLQERQLPRAGDRLQHLHARPHRRRALVVPHQRRPHGPARETDRRGRRPGSSSPCCCSRTSATPTAGSGRCSSPPAHSWPSSWRFWGSGMT